MTAPTPLRVGMIGLDTSHCPIFTDAINTASPDSEFAGLRVVAAFPAGNLDFPLSRDRVAGITEDLRGKGVRIVGSIDELLACVDVVLLESVDGGQHLEQIEPVFRAGKRVFIDKPLASTLRDCLRIVELGKRHNASWFTASSLRFMPGFQRLRTLPELGKLVGCDAFSQTRFAPGHGDLYWYGMHGVEPLMMLMGPGCLHVTRTQTAWTEQVTGVWGDGRVGTFRGIREQTGKTAFGLTVFGTEAIVHEICQADYRPMLLEIARFFRTGVVPIAPSESLEVFRFIEAAEESKRRGGAAVTLAEVTAKAGG
ncbi:MAG: Gfo/Idh/MocA family oxidoreductase [Planctomycetota bacterium]|nr:Gfo/Idh/MocA family oxidoreductase [Planctomycetota bacterium]